MTVETARKRTLGHVISSEQFDRPLLDRIFQRALDRRTVVLALPTNERTAVIFEN